MKIVIRNEKIEDYNKIACINYEAFHNWKKDNHFVKESLMVDVLRHNSLFDPELSLIAELEGEIVGHVLLSPFIFTMKGKEVKGAILGPIAVKPEHQKSGIGKLLIEKAHSVAENKGYQLSLLCGHPEYYPKFGYKTSMFALSGCSAKIEDESLDLERYSERPVETRDVEWITEEWSKIHSEDELAIMPGKTIVDWSNHGSPCYNSMITKDDEILGFVRYQLSDSIDVKEILGNDESVTEMLKYLAVKLGDESRSSLKIALPFEKVSKIVEKDNSIVLEDAYATYAPFMIKPLGDENGVVTYCRDVELGKVKAGIISLPPVFDIEEC